MEHAEVSGLLYTAEVVHWVTLAVMGIVYALRLMWLFKFKAGRDRQAPGERLGDTSPRPLLDGQRGDAMGHGELAHQYTVVD